MWVPAPGRKRRFAKGAHMCVCLCVFENKHRVVRVTEIRVKVCMTFFTVSVIEITEECVSRAY